MLNRSKPIRFLHRQPLRRNAVITPRRDTVTLNIEGNEESLLHGGNLDSSTPLWQDGRWWIRLPASAILAVYSAIYSAIYPAILAVHPAIFSLFNLLFLKYQVIIVPVLLIMWVRVILPILLVKAPFVRYGNPGASNLAPTSTYGL
jgi:hypothetical protein